MSLTYEEAYDEMAEMIKAAWDVTGYQAFYETVRDEQDTSTEPFIYYSCKIAGAFQAAMGAATGQRMFRRTGQIIIQLFCRSGKGLSESLQLAKVIADAYEGKSSPGGVWFKNVVPKDQGRDGMFQQTNVVIDFEYDEIK
jgi:hypothetical protein